MSQEVEPYSAVTQYLNSFNVADARKRPRLLALLFCNHTNTTKDDKANLIGVFDRVFVHPEVKKTPQFVIFIRTAETTQEPMLLSVFNPDGTPAVAFEFASDVTEHKFTPDRPAQVQFIAGMRFDVGADGIYWFDVSYKGESIGGAGLVVEFRETEDKEGGTDTYT